MSTETGSCTITTARLAFADEERWPNPRPGWDRQRPDYQAWIRNLEAEGIQLLVVTRVNPSEGPHNVADSRGLSDRAPLGRFPSRAVRTAVWSSRAAIPGFDFTVFRRSVF